MLGAAGGHGDYAGNEVDALALNVASPRWVQLRAPSATADIIDNAEFYLDLRGAASHTYYATQFIDSLNRMMIFGSPGMDWTSLPRPPAGWPYAGNPGYTKSFNLATNDWDDPRAFARFTGGGSDIACLCVKHPVTQDVYYARNGAGWQRWNAAANTWTALPGPGRSEWYAGAAIDPNRGRMLIVGGYSSTPPTVRDLNGNVMSVSFGGLGQSALTLSGYPGVVYDEINDAYLAVYNSGGSVAIRRVNAANWSVDAPAITGGAPAARQNGILNAIQYVPELRGIVLANSYSGNVYFMRTAA